MPMHLGTTGGLIIGLALTGISASRKWKATGSPEAVMNNLVESATGYDMGDPGKGHNIHTMRLTVPILVGGGITYIAKKTGYNDDTPKGVNV